MPRDYNKERDEFRADDRFVRGEAGHSGRRWLWWGVGMVALMTVMGVGLSYCGTASRVATAPGRIIERTVDPERVIQNYEWFRTQYQDIESFTQQIEIQGAARNRFLCEMRDVPRREWSDNDQYRYGQIDDRFNGLQAQRRRMIGEYNARTAMLNRNLFRGADVPASIPEPELVPTPSNPCT